MEKNGEFKQSAALILLVLSNSNICFIKSFAFCDMALYSFTEVLYFPVFIFSNNCCLVFPTKGKFPVSITYKTTPADHISHFSL